MGNLFFPADAGLYLASPFPHLIIIGQRISQLFLRPSLSSWGEAPASQTTSLPSGSPPPSLWPSPDFGDLSLLCSWPRRLCESETGHQQLHSFPQLRLPELGPRKTNCSSMALWQPSFNFCFNEEWERNLNPAVICILKHSNRQSTCLALCVLWSVFSALPFLKLQQFCALLCYYCMCLYAGPVGTSALNPLHWTAPGIPLEGSSQSLKGKGEGEGEVLFGEPTLVGYKRQPHFTGRDFPDERVQFPCQTKQHS